MTTLNPEDLMRLRRYNAKDATIECRPEVFSRDELMEHFLDKQLFIAELLERYEVTVSSEFEIDVYSGEIR